MTKTIILTCDVCRAVITGSEYCTPHITHAFDDDVDTHYHADCCPECNADEDAADEAAWQDFINNEKLHSVAESLGL